MFAGRTESWNLRDTHMMQTLSEAVARDIAGAQAGTAPRGVRQGTPEAGTLGGHAASPTETTA